MSTPTTATTTALPHYHRVYSFAHHPSYQTNPTVAAYRSNALAPTATNPILAAAAASSSSSSSAVSSSTIPHTRQQQHIPYVASTSAYSPVISTPTHSVSSTTLGNGLISVPSPVASHASFDALLDHTLDHRPDATHSSASTMSTAVHPPSVAIDHHSSTRKRRRSRGPDWSTFYRNGLPKEVIVIDDSPPPPEVTLVASASLSTAQQLPLDAQTNGSGSRNAPKRRRRDEEVAHYDPVYLSSKHTTSHASTTHQNSTLSTSTSTDRTASAAITTAATSLSSNSQYDYDIGVQAGQKRKRTRQQIANEAKRKEIEALGDHHITYHPPPNPPKKAQEVHVRVVPDNEFNRNIKIDDDDGHYIVVPEADLTEKYQMVRLLGQGTFGKVVQARDKRRNKPVAIKIIRSVQKYRDASRIELRVLATLKANDEENRNRCIHLRDTFDFRGHICIVMDLLGQSVFDFLKSNNFVPFPNSQIQSFARQLLTSVAFLHDLNLIHTDLKPENILLCDNTYQTFTYNRKIPSSSQTQNRQANQRRVLLDTEIRLIDFGSATFQDEYHSSVVSTRHYRAPEIILGLGWSYPCDIWSIGCILVEFFTGDALFQTHDNLEHLAMMEAVVGSRIDSHLVQAVNRSATRNAGNPAAKYFKRLKLDYPTPDTTRTSRRFVKAMKNLNDIIPTPNTFLKNFLDLLRKIFVYDPKQRITAKEALQHPWFREVTQPDDGTEAAKIRNERRRMDQVAMEARGLPPMRVG